MYLTIIRKKVLLELEELSHDAVKVAPVLRAPPTPAPAAISTDAALSDTVLRPSAVGLRRRSFLLASIGGRR